MFSNNTSLSNGYIDDEQQQQQDKNEQEKKLGTNSILLDGDDDEEEDNADDDDNAETSTTAAPVEDPFTTSIESLEEIVVTSLDSFKLHPGTRTSQTSKGVAEELKEILTTVLEIGAHTGPIQARSHAAYRHGGVDESVDEMYNRINRDLILPVILEAAQSEQRVSKRTAALQFFHLLYKECLSGGSYLDKSCGNNLNYAGPYGSGNSSGGSSGISNRFTLRRRNITRATREGELLKHWVEASIGCLVTGIFTASSAEASICSKAVLSANASIRPALRYIAANISAADDAGATRLYKPVMCMIEGVLRRLFCSNSLSEEEEDVSYDAMRSTCVKFLETVVLCFSYSNKGGTAAGGVLKKKVANPEDFSLDMLPTGHPIIKREVLEEIGEYAFTAMRGLVIVGGQVQIDRNLLPDLFSSSSANHEVEESSSKVIAIIKPAVLAFLDVTDTYSSMQEYDSPVAGEAKQTKRVLDRRNLELDFFLTQKSYALTINALSIASTTRPNLFQSAATTLAERTMDPPSKRSFQFVSTPSLNDVSTVIVTSQLKATCLTLLRNPLSVTKGGSDVLLQALICVHMSLQAQKALSVAKEQAALKTAGRAARNRAKLYYQWDNTTTDNTPMTAADQRSSKRKRETDDALAKMRAAKMARGLGNGIQLPPSMVDAIELILVNLDHIPDKAAVTSKQQQQPRKVPITLDYVVDAVMSNGASLQSDENRWYERDGGAAWKLLLQSNDDNGHTFNKQKKRRLQFTINTTTSAKDDTEQTKLFQEQCHQASADAFGRIIISSTTKKYSNKATLNTLTQLSNQISARLAFLLKGVPVPSEFKDAYAMACDTVNTVMISKHQDEANRDSMKAFLKDYPLATSCLALDVIAKPLQQSNNKNISAVPTTTTANSTTNMDLSSMASSLPNRILNEAHLQQTKNNNNNNIYEQSLDLFVSTIVHSSELSNEKVHDLDRKRVSTQAASSLPLQLTLLPSITHASIQRISALCNMEDLNHNKALDSKNKGVHNNTIASNAAIHACKAAAEKRATSALLTLRDIAFTKTKTTIRQSAIDCAVGIASGRIPSSPSIEDKALKLIMNVFFPKSDVLADIVVNSAEKELNIAADYAIKHFDKILKANEKLLLSSLNTDDTNHNSRANTTTNAAANSSTSEEEKVVMEKVKKPALLFMALCVRQPETIQTLMTISCRDGADVLSKAVRSDMPKLARAAATKYGAATIARKVADMVKERETPLLLAFLDNLVSHDGPVPESDFVDACLDIQLNKLKPNGKKDPRYIVPIVSVMKRSDLVQKLPDFVAETDVVFKAALVRMGERLTRQAFHYREDKEVSAGEDPDSSILGMTQCEQLVFLHFLNFQSAKLPQKRYLETIRLCIEDEQVYSDRVIMSALDYISGRFLQGDQGLPLAYMRTIILTCTKHESLHLWICHVLLPRLIEGKVYDDRRQWEGWMRCAKMLESPESAGGVSSIEAIQKLPEEQLKMYRSKYPVV